MKKSSSILSLLFFFHSPSVWSKIDFENLKHCMTSLRAPLISRTDKAVLPRSQFISTLNWKSRENYEINALIYHEEVDGMTRVHVIQDIETNRRGLFSGLRNQLNQEVPNINRTYVYNSSDLKAYRCNSREPQSVLPLGGHCKGSGESRCPMAKVGFSLGVENNQTTFCPSSVTHAEVKRGYQREVDLTTSQSEEIVKKAILEQIEFLSRYQASGKLQFDKNNVIQALYNKAYCLKALEPSPVEIRAAASPLLCQLSPLDREVCLQGDVGPNPIDPQMMKATE